MKKWIFDAEAEDAVRDRKPRKLKLDCLYEFPWKCQKTIRKVSNLDQQSIMNHQAKTFRGINMWFTEFLVVTFTIEENIGFLFW